MQPENTAPEPDMIDPITDPIMEPTTADAMPADSIVTEPTTVNPTKEDASHHHITLKAHKIGDVSLTVMTVVLVIVSLWYDASFAPFIILLMSSRIGKSVYTIIKTTSKKEMGKLVIWLALFGKSAASCVQLLAGMA